MYERFYGLTGRPFQLTPDPKFFFESTVHKRAASYLLYGLSQGEGFIVITGEVGAGKTTLLRHLLSTLNGRNYIAAQIVTSQLSADAVLTMVANAFGVSAAGGDKGAVLSGIERFFADNHRQGRRCLLVVDEAQNLSISALEELRMLSNFQIGNYSPLQSFLVGQPQFRQLLSSSDLDQLRQRVIASYHLGPMDEAESAAYIVHRLRMVGWAGTPEFTADCHAAIFQHSRGIPRRINTLASRLLLFGFLEQQTVFTATMVDSVAEELRAEIGSGRPDEPGDDAPDREALGDLPRRLEAVEASCARLDRTFKHVVSLLADSLQR